MIVEFEIIEGVLHGPFPDNVDVDIDLAKQIVIEFMDGKSYPSLIEASGIKTMTKEARDYFSSPEGSVGIVSAALLTNNSFSNFLMNFLIQVTFIRPHVTLKAFTDKEKAIEWLKTFVDED